MRLPTLSSHFFIVHKSQSNMAGGLLLLFIGLELSALSNYFPFRLFCALSVVLALIYIVIKMKEPCRCEQVWVAKNNTEVVLTLVIPLTVLLTFVSLSLARVIFRPMLKEIDYLLSSLFLLAGTAMLLASRRKYPF